MAFAWALLRPLLPSILGAIAFMALLAYGKHELNVWADNRAAPKIAAITAERDAARTELASFQEQQRAKAAQLVLDWDSARDRADKAEKDLANERAKRFAGVAVAARAGLGSVADIRIPVSASRVLDDAIDAANSALAPAPAGEPSKDAEAPATVADLTQSAVACYQQYADAVDQILGLQRFYNDLRK